MIFILYDRYARLLKWSALGLLAYVVALTVPNRWANVAHAIVWPRVVLYVGLRISDP